MHKTESQQPQARSTKAQQAEPSKQKHEAATFPGGMGAFLAQNGSPKSQVGFRVWAPNAQAVSVIGDFNDWSPTANPLTHEAAGYWAGLVSEAKVGDEYKFFLQTAQGELQRVDPYMRGQDEQPDPPVVVIVNFANQVQSDYPVALPAAGEWQVLFNSDARHYDETFDDQGSTAVTAQVATEGPLSHWGQVTLAPYSALILGRNQ